MPFNCDVCGEEVSYSEKCLRKNCTNNERERIRRTQRR